MKAAYRTWKSLSHEDVSAIIINHIPSLGITKNFKKNKSKTKRRTNKQPNNQTRKGCYIIRFDTFQVTFEWGRRGRDRMVVGLIATYAINAYHHESSNPVRGVVYTRQHYVIKFVSNLGQFGGFLPVLRFPLPTKLTTTI